MPSCKHLILPMLLVQNVALLQYHWKQIDTFFLYSLSQHWFYFVYSFLFSSKTVCCPGKAGGNFILPLGGKLIVPEGTCGKRDTIVCLVPPPNERWKMIPHFQGEHLTSEIYILTGTVNLKVVIGLVVVLFSWNATGLSSDSLEESEAVDCVGGVIPMWVFGVFITT